MEGQLDTVVSAEVAEHLLAVLREALSNLVRHARAFRADVAVTAEHNALTLVVEDDGIGIPPDARRSGLRNLAERAEALGGTLTITTLETGGTRLTWTALLVTEQSGG